MFYQFPRKFEGFLSFWDGVWQGHWLLTLDLVRLDGDRLVNLILLNVEVKFEDRDCETGLG